MYFSVSINFSTMSGMYVWETGSQQLKNGLVDYWISRCYKMESNIVWLANCIVFFISINLSHVMCTAFSRQVIYQNSTRTLVAQVNITFPPVFLSKVTRMGDPNY